MRAVAEADPPERESRSAAAPSAVRAAYERMSGELSADPWPCGGIWLARRIPAESEVPDAVHAGVKIEVAARRTAIAAAEDADVKPRARRSDDQWGATVASPGTGPAIPRARTKQPRGSIGQVFESDSVGVSHASSPQPAAAARAAGPRVPIAAAAWAGIELTPAHGPRLRARCPRCGLSRSRQRERRDAGIGGQCQHRGVETGPWLADVAGIGADRGNADTAAVAFGETGSAQQRVDVPAAFTDDAVRRREHPPPVNDHAAAVLRPRCVLRVRLEHRRHPRPLSWRGRRAPDDRVRRSRRAKRCDGGEEAQPCETADRDPMPETATHAYRNRGSCAATPLQGGVERHRSRWRLRSFPPPHRSTPRRDGRRRARRRRRRSRCPPPARGSRGSPPGRGPRPRHRDGPRRPRHPAGTPRGR